jgi:hypothetical protein
MRERTTRRRSLVFALAVAAATAGALAFWRKGTRRRARVDLYFADGSKASLPAGSAEGAELLSLAREALAAAR